ncbi:hypothetical protein R1flu_029190 [Riccia fluitans]|uniref:BHLH domain-containing protein n=1 Tax=Riccia fluitans TaxID=41844 RepID=A0ABD1XNW7_9MARC
MRILGDRDYSTPFGQEEAAAEDNNVVVTIDEEYRENPSHLDSPLAIQDFEGILGCSTDETGDDVSCSELTYNFRLFEEYGTCCEVGSSKRGFRELEEVGSQAPFSKQSEEEHQLEAIFSCSDTSVIADAFSGDSLNPEGDGQSSEEEVYEDLDESALELQILCDDFGFEMPEEELKECDNCSRKEEEEGGGEEEEEDGGDAVSSGSARKSRRAKIQKTLKLLREVIPGGSCMDSAIVLDETINYVRLLQWQVQTLVAQRRSIFPTK